MTVDPYNDEVRGRFSSPRFAGVAEGSSARRNGQDVDIEVSAVVEDDRLATVRFRAYGCPHTIAACDLACERLEGERADALAGLAADELMRTLSVPVEKTGRILVLEDAFRDLNSRLVKP